MQPDGSRELIGWRVGRVPAANWRWRMANGKFIAPHAMDTHHLFNTVCMLWNHSMPSAARTHNYRRYTFPSIYSRDYLRTAVRVLLPELMGRELTNYQLHTLERMLQWLRARNLSIDNGIANWENEPCLLLT